MRFIKINKTCIYLNDSISNEILKRYFAYDDIYKLTYLHIKIYCNNKNREIHRRLVRYLPNAIFTFSI